MGNIIIAASAAFAVADASAVYSQYGRRPNQAPENGFTAGAGVIAILSESASAADLARPAPVYAPPPPPIIAVFTWTGCYIGGNIGGIWANSDWQDTVLGDFGSSTGSGVLGGGQIGCNYQLGSWVLVSRVTMLGQTPTPTLPIQSFRLLSVAPSWDSRIPRSTTHWHR